MRKLFFIIALSLASMLDVKAEDYKNWNGIDEVTIEQQVDVNTSKVYIVAHSTAKPKNENKVDKQQAAFDELGKTLVAELKKTFGKATYTIVNDAKEAPADALLIEVGIDEIDWGNGALRQLVGMGAGMMWGNYSAKVSNANGLVCKLKNRRAHDTTFASAKGPAVIKAYNKALVKDLIITLKGGN